MDQEEIDAQIAAAFAGSKKKKKKAVVIEEPIVASNANDGGAETPEEVATTEPSPALDSMFGDMKKKKKKSKMSESSAVEGFEDDGLDVESVPVASYPPMEEGTPADPSLDAFSTSKKKKKKKTAFADFEAQIRAGEEGGEADEASAQETLDEPWLSSNRDYTYNELLTRVFNILRAKNPEIRGEKRTYTIVPPAVSREGTKKTAFSNILDIAKRMRRQPDHVIQFLFAELGTSGSMDGSQRLVIKGRFQPKQIESVLKKYIVEYVSCKTCKSADTILTKENRLFFVQCESCGSTRSVSAINRGFVAELGKKKKTE